MENDLLDRVRADPYFAPIIPELDSLLEPSSFIGRAPEQVDRFIKEWVEPALADEELQKAIQSSKRVELNV